MLAAGPNACTDLGRGAGNVQIYGPVNVYTDAKPEIWRVPEGAEPWTGDQGNQWRGWGCGGYPCDERCGAFCWYRRVRNGYCGHGCDAYREHVMFQPMGETLRPFIYRNPPVGNCGYGPSGGYGLNGCGRAPRLRITQARTATAGLRRAIIIRRAMASARGYYPANNGSARGYYPAEQWRRLVSPEDPTVPRVPMESASLTVSGAIFTANLVAKFTATTAPSVTTALVRFERPSNELVPLRRFNGPKYPPNSIGTVTNPQRPQSSCLLYGVKSQEKRRRREQTELTSSLSSCSLSRKPA